MVGPDTAKASVSSHTQTSAVEAIIDSRRSRTGSPSALNIGASPAACSPLSGAAASGERQVPATSGGACFDMPLDCQATPALATLRSGSGGAPGVTPPDR